MSWNDAAMVIAANTLRGAALYGQLHTASAGSSGTSNLASSGRQPLTWTSASGAGDFDLAAMVNFTGGAANGVVYSMTAWSASSSGTFYGEFPVASGDGHFNSLGEFSYTSINNVGSAADA